MKANKLISALLSAAFMLSTAAPFCPEAAVQMQPAAAAAPVLNGRDYVPEDVKMLYGYIRREVTHAEFAEYSLKEHNSEAFDFFDYNSNGSIDAIDLTLIFRDLQTNDKISYTVDDLDVLMRYLEKSVGSGTLNSYAEENYYVGAGVLFDLNADGKVDTNDAALLREKLVAKGYAVTEIPGVTTTAIRTTGTTVSTTKRTNAATTTTKPLPKDLQPHDLDCNGKTDTNDLYIMLDTVGTGKYSYGSRDYAYYWEDCHPGEVFGDLDGNKTVDIRDAYLLQNYIESGKSFDSYESGTLEDSLLEISLGDRGYGYVYAIKGETVSVPVFLSGSAASFALSLEIDTRDLREFEFTPADNSIQFVRDYYDAAMTLIRLSSEDTDFSGDENRGGTYIGSISFIMPDDNFEISLARYSVPSSAIDSKGNYLNFRCNYCNVRAEEPYHIETMPPVIRTTAPITATTKATTRPVTATTKPAIQPATTTKAVTTDGTTNDETKPATGTGTTEAVTETTVQTTPQDFMLGNLNDDGTVSVEDAQITLNAYVRILANAESGLTELQILAADINGDKVISVDDAQLILLYYVKNQLAGVSVTWDELLGKAKPAQALPFRKKIRAFFRDDDIPEA